MFLSAEWLNYPLTSFQALVFSYRQTVESINGGLSSATGRSSSLIG